MTARPVDDVVGEGVLGQRLPGHDGVHVLAGIPADHPRAGRLDHAVGVQGELAPLHPQHLRVPCRSTAPRLPRARTGERAELARLRSGRRLEHRLGVRPRARGHADDLEPHAPRRDDRREAGAAGADDDGAARVQVERR